MSKCPFMFVDKNHGDTGNREEIVENKEYECLTHACALYDHKYSRCALLSIACKK